MKIEIKSRFIVSIEMNRNHDILPMSELVLKNLTFASIAGGFEKMYQSLLIQNPDILTAELISIEEIQED